jgi:hypothetical protein
MHMRNLEGAVRSLPLKVRFLGFESDTRTLAGAGWGFAMREQHAYAYAGTEMQMALKYDFKDGGHIYAWTKPLIIPYEDFERLKNGVSHEAYLHIFSNYGFDVIHIGNSPQFRVFPIMHRGASIMNEFNPIDPMTQEVTETMDQLRFFKVAKPSIKDLIVDPSSVPELMDLVLKAQRPAMEEIKRREKSRLNEAWMRTGMEIKPAHEVKAQIITLTS